MFCGINSFTHTVLVGAVLAIGTATGPLPPPPEGEGGPEGAPVKEVAAILFQEVKGAGPDPVLPDVPKHREIVSKSY